MKSALFAENGHVTEKKRFMISLKGKTILVVDDEPGYREVIGDEFILAGATVLQAENGTIAFAIVQKQKVDAIVSDIRMPGGDGISLLEVVKKINCNLPVVALITGFSDVLPEDAYAKGAEAIFSKPCDMDALIERVYRALLPEKDRWLRKFDRLTTDFVVELEIESLEEPIKKVKTRVINIGRGGMFVAIENPPNINTRVSFSIALSFDKKTFEGTAICRWKRDSLDSTLANGMGVEFQDLTEDSLQILLQTLKQLNPVGFIPKE